MSNQATTPAPEDALESRPRVLFVDDEPSVLSAMKRVFRGQGFEIMTVESGKEGLELLEISPVDLVISDMRMPEMDGAQFLEQVFACWPETKRILLTGYADTTSTIAAINQGKIWRYIAKPWDDAELILTAQQALAHQRLMRENARLSELTRQQNEELKMLNAGLEQKVAERTAELQTANTGLHQSFLSTVQVFSNLIELREGLRAGHSRRVADLARQMAERLDLDEGERRTVLLAGLLHDIGKVGLPDKLLDRAFNSLSPLEKADLMRHPVKGQQLLLGVPQLTEAARIIRHHHEYIDGSGYPDRLHSLMIPLGARILALANDYDELQCGVLTLQRHSPKSAKEYIVKLRGVRYDPAVVDAFTALMDGEEWQAGGELGIGPSVTRNRPVPPPPRIWKEVALRTARLKEGMMLARSLYHQEGFLLLARGYRLDDNIIHQLHEIEAAYDKPITLHIRVDDR